MTRRTSRRWSRGFDGVAGRVFAVERLEVAKHIDNKPIHSHFKHIAPPGHWSLELHFTMSAMLICATLTQKYGHTRNANELDFS